MLAGSFFSGGLTVIAARVSAFCFKFQVFFHASVGQESRKRVVAERFLFRVGSQAHLRIRVNACTRNHIEGVYACMPGATESSDIYVIPAMQCFREDSQSKGNPNCFSRPLLLCFFPQSAPLVLLLSRPFAFSSCCFLVPLFSRLKLLGTNPHYQQNNR